MPLDGLAPSSHSQLAAVSVSHTASHARNGLRAREGAVSGGALVMVAKRQDLCARLCRLNPQTLCTEIHQRIFREREKATTDLIAASAATTCRHTLWRCCEVCAKVLCCHMR